MVSIGVLNELTEDMANERTTVTYPYILVENATEALAIVMEALEEGDVPVCLNYKGNTHILDKRISKNPLNINKLLKVYPILFCLSETEKYKITNIQQVLDLPIW